MPPPDIPPKGTDNSGAKPQLTNQERMNIEREQDHTLKAKFPLGARPLRVCPGLGAAGGGTVGNGQSAFLEKRLAKWQNHFDSADYQMAKQTKPMPGAPGRIMIPVLPQQPIGDTNPTPDTAPARKTSIIQPVHDHRFVTK